MIDLHTHLLPQIDDGAGSVKEALEMAELLVSQKIKIAVCTPHFDPSADALMTFLLKRENALSRLKGSKLQMIPASETKLHEYLFHYPDLLPLCIARTRYLLLELPFDQNWDSKLFTLLDKVMTYYDIIPVIAHIERYPAVKRQMKHIRRLKNMGCLLQLNSSSLFDKSTAKRALLYMKKDYIDVIGSDCHNLKTRPPQMDLAINRIIQILGEGYYKQLEDNAASIIQGKELRTNKSLMIESLGRILLLGE